jgi:hypothetical protein
MKTGRNDPCPCGSGQKYKKCCAGKEAVQAVEQAAEVAADAATEAAAAPEAETPDNAPAGRLRSVTWLPVHRQPLAPRRSRMSRKPAH